MNTRPPLTLRFNGGTFGRIVTYGYETPWACGRFEPVDDGALRPLIELGELYAEIDAWPDLPANQDDDRWRSTLESRSLTDADPENYESGVWIIETQDGTQHEIYSPLFERNGFVTWRW